MENIVVETKFADDAGEVMIVKLKGYIDQTNSFSLQKVFNDIINSGCYKLIIDFSEVMYVSSAGWGIFVGEIKRFRDENGDIKLTNMTPNIYEVYQMLEFYHIFEDYNSIANALSSFSGNVEENVENIININDTEASIQLDLTDSENEVYVENDDQHFNKSAQSIDITFDNEPLNTILNEEQGRMVDQEPEVINLSKLPINEKIKKIVAQYPLLSIRQIKKLLKDERFGDEKIGFFKLYKLLKQLDLETKIKRYRYFRSC